jgi:hypothetical protein
MPPASKAAASTAAVDASAGVALQAQHGDENNSSRANFKPTALTPDRIQALKSEVGEHDYELYWKPLQPGKTIEACSPRSILTVLTSVFVSRCAHALPASFSFAWSCSCKKPPGLFEAP